MNAERLLALHDRVAEVPDAVVRLRRFVLDLAVRGKLVEQDPADEPAVELLKRIAVEKARLVEAGRIRKPKSISPVDDPPFAVPETWQWVHFGNIVDFSAGRTPSRKEPSFWNNGDYSWISIADMKDGETVQATRESVSDKARSDVFKSEPEAPGTIIMSFKLTIGKIARLGIPAFHNEAIISIRPNLDELDQFLFKFLPNLARGGDTKEAVKGATLNRESLSRIVIPLPPLAEQHRIVAKVDELMALCDRMEEARNEREETRDRLTTASLAHLSTPDTDAGAFRAHARFAVEALSALTARSDQVVQLRQTILNLAVRGKLVEQDPTDEPAVELLKRTAAEKARLVKAGAIKPQQTGKNRVSSPARFALPVGWEWAYLQAVCMSITDGDHLPPPKAERGVPFLVISNIRTQTINYRSERWVPRSYYEALDSSRQPRPGDLLYTLVGSFGIPVEVLDAKEFCVQRHIGIIRPAQWISSPFLARMMASQFINNQADACATGIAQKTVPLSGLRSLLIPLPPLAEQQRIVAKVDELMALCDRLEAGLAASDATRVRLLESLLHEALTPGADKDLTSTSALSASRVDTEITANPPPAPAVQPPL